MNCSALFRFAVKKNSNDTPCLFVKLLQAWHYITVQILHQSGKSPTFKTC